MSTDNTSNEQANLLDTIKTVLAPFVAPVALNPAADAVTGTVQTSLGLALASFFNGSVIPVKTSESRDGSSSATQRGRPKGSKNKPKDDESVADKSAAVAKKAKPDPEPEVETETADNGNDSNDNNNDSNEDVTASDTDELPPIPDEETSSEDLQDFFNN